MTFEEIVNIHMALHQGEPWVRVGGDVVHITHVDRPGKQYSSASYGNCNFLTQNMQKESPNTRWVLENPKQRALTWITAKAGGYIGKIRQEGSTIEVFYLNPERRVFTTEI